VRAQPSHDIQQKVVLLGSRESKQDPAGKRIIQQEEVLLGSRESKQDPAGKRIPVRLNHSQLQQRSKSAAE
jgi:hypothetical protein